MKLGKEEIQKIFLGVLVLIGVLYYYFSMLLGPLDKKEADAKAKIAQLTPQIDEANKTIKGAMPFEKKGTEATETLDQIKSLIPDGAPIAWFPPKIIDFFKRQGIEKTAVHLGGENTDKDLPGFKKLIWSLDIPRVDVVQLGIAIAALENEHPLIEINSLQIEDLKDNVQYQSAKITLTTTIK